MEGTWEHRDNVSVLPICLNKEVMGWRSLTPKIFAEVEDGGDGQQIFEVLGTESDDFALGDEEGEFIFCLRCEAAELDARDLGACGGCHMVDMGA